MIPAALCLATLYAVEVVWIAWSVRREGKR